jgi:hypothetical protein
MLITTWPLYSSKSFHKTFEQLELKLHAVLKITEDYYEHMGKEFLYQENWYSGEYPGVLVYKIWPEKPYVMKLVGKPKSYTRPETDDGRNYGMDTSIEPIASDGTESESSLPAGDNWSI